MSKGQNNSINITKGQKLPFLDDFLLFLTTSNYSKATIRNYERDLLIFEDFLHQNTWNFDDLTKKHITIYISDLLSEDRRTLAKNAKGERLTPKSINRMLTSLRTYLSYLIDNDYATPLLPQHVKLMKLGKKILHLPPIEILIGFIESPESLEKNSFVGIRNRTILELIFASGMRISEVVTLSMKQIGQRDRVFIKGKGNKERFVYLTPRSLEVLARYLDARQQYINSLLPKAYRDQKFIEKFEYVFVTKKTFDTLSSTIQGNELPPTLLESHISPNYLQAKIKQYRHLLGVLEPLSAHTLRHGFATYLAESGANPAAIKVLLGHESLETTTRYVHASDNFARDTHGKFHPLKK